MRIALSVSFAVSVSAASLLAHRVPVGPFDRRQVSVGSQSPVPSQCTSTCNPVNDEVSLGCPVTACCTTTFENQYYNCLDCIGKVLNATNYATAQNDLNLLYTTCVDMGFVLPQLALPGQPASGSGSSADPHTPSTGSVSAMVPFPTTAGGVAPSGSSTTATGAAINARWPDVQTVASISAAVLLGTTRLW